MSRFSGKQYPGAMKDHRARKRLEANRRNYDYWEARAAENDESDLRAVGSAAEGAASQGSPAFVLPVGMTVGPASSLFDDGGVLPAGVTELRNDSGRDLPALTGAQWAEVHRLAKESGAGE